MANKIELTARDSKKLASQYRKGAGLVELSLNWGHSIQVIRRLLTDADVTIRKAGRQQGSGYGL